MCMAIETKEKLRVVTDQHQTLQWLPHVLCFFSLFLREEAGRIYVDNVKILNDTLYDYVQLL